MKLLTLAMIASGYETDIAHATMQAVAEVASYNVSLYGWLDDEDPGVLNTPRGY